MYTLVNLCLHTKTIYIYMYIHRCVWFLFLYQIFENEAEKALKSTLLQYGARDYYIKAGILHIVIGDIVNAKIAIDKYSSNDPRFASSRERKFLDNIIDAITEQNVEYFEEVVHEYDRVTKLDNWKIYFLYNIKSKLNVEGNVKFTPDGGVDLTQIQKRLHIFVYTYMY